MKYVELKWNNILELAQEGYTRTFKKPNGCNALVYLSAEDLRSILNTIKNNNTSEDDDKGYSVLFEKLKQCQERTKELHRQHNELQRLLEEL